MATTNATLQRTSTLVPDHQAQCDTNNREKCASCDPGFSMESTKQLGDEEFLFSSATDGEVGCGWQLVRRLSPSSNAWHPTDDNLAGTDVYQSGI